jgi:hypothetical protein
VSIDVIIPISTVTAANGWTRRTTNAQSEAEAISGINAMQAVETALTNGQWPENAVAGCYRRDSVMTPVGFSAEIIEDGFSSAPSLVI